MRPSIVLDMKRSVAREVISRTPCTANPRSFILWDSVRTALPKLLEQLPDMRRESENP
ncbi:MAG: hypothetical protein LBI62_00975 [Candidatus Accumulibacter sp.]|jgi:hypothetical protein|nr:hypothetical protein [Accumulibacter sp.]